jgi:RNA polymerase sigma-70 factor, ECF subfamily
MSADMAARLRSGEEPQIRTVVARYEPVLRRIARRHVRADAVDDVVQEVWIAALRGVDRFEGRGSFEGWLVSITANIARTWGVREARSTPVEALPEEQAGADTHPEQRLLAAEQLRTAKEAVETLTPTLRSALELGERPGLDTAQRVRLSRARRHVRRALATA